MKNPQNDGPPSRDDFLHFHDIFRPEGSVLSKHTINSSGINNYLKVFSSIHQTLETNSDIVSLIPGFFEAREVFKEYVYRLSEKYSKIKDNLTGLSLKVASALRSYGVMTENTELITFSNLKDSSIKSLSDSELIRRADKLLKNARLYSSTMNYFGIAFESLTEFEVTLSKFSYATGLLSENFFYSPEWRDEFDKGFDEAYSFIYNTLDNYLEKVKDKFPKFYNEYNSAKALLHSKEQV